MKKETKKELIRRVNESNKPRLKGKLQEACEGMNIPYSQNLYKNVSKWLRGKNVDGRGEKASSDVEVESEQLKEARDKQYDKKKKRFLISWAQSGTEVHKGFLKNMEAYSDFIGADIHIICGRYKNPTSLEASKVLEEKEKNKGLVWHDSVVPYLDANRQKIHKHLSILSDLKIMPTAVTPLTGLNSLTSLESCIVGHPSLHLSSLPVLPNYPNKLLLTTGAVTLPNYSDTKAGKKAEFHHTLGFVIVELDGKHFHIRQVQCDEKDGSFYDLKYKVDSGVVKLVNESYPAIVLGDLHLPNEDKDVVSKTFELIDNIGFDKIILHDVLDCKSINHHEEHDPFISHEKANNHQDSLDEEIAYLMKWFEDRQGYNFVSVMSNHVDFLDRHLRDADWRTVKHKKTFLELALLKLDNPRKSVLNALISKFDNVQVLEYGDSLRIKDYEVSLHGDHGNAGSRGTPNQFKNLNTKTITAHTHSPSRQLGNLVAGTCTKMDLGYNIGLCSWLQGSVIIYPNGKASHIHYVNKKFTTLY